MESVFQPKDYPQIPVISILLCLVIPSGGHVCVIELIAQIGHYLAGVDDPMLLGHFQRLSSVSENG